MPGPSQGSCLPKSFAITDIILVRIPRFCAITGFILLKWMNETEIPQLWADVYFVPEEQLAALMLR